MLSRRTMMALTASGLAGSRFAEPAFAQDGPVLGEDGLYHQSWFLNSFLELKDDITEASNKSKRLAIFWELKGCPYCKETHFKNFARPDIQKYIRANFEILQLNVLGSKMVTDVDGAEMSEKALARKYGIRFSPTILFLHDDADKLANAKPRKREAARAQGYLQPEHFLTMFRFVHTRAYEKMSFRKYLRSQKPS